MTIGVVEVTARVRLLAAVALALPGLVLSGCLSIKSQTTTQRAPGVLALRVTACASDYNQSTYTTCDDSNVAETDELRADADGASPALGQVLLGFRVPVGSDGPASFASAATDVNFSRSTSYTQQLTSRFAPPAGTHWVGYISTPKTFDPADSATRQTDGAPEFTLPAQPGGEPFTGPFAWRPVVGWRQLENVGQAGRTVNCDDATVTTQCIDSPTHARVPSNLSATTSDFGVLSASAVTAGHGETANVSFPIRYVDGRGLGTRQLSVAAATNVPASAATAGATVVAAASNSITNVAVSVPVPPGTPLGPYTTTLTAATGTPAVTRSNSITINVVDKIAPRIQIGTPGQDATFLVGQRATADYSCSDELNGSQLRSCEAPVASGAALDTRTPGTKTFTVSAVDNAGNTALLSRTYRVVAVPPQRIVVTVVFSHAVNSRGTRFTRLVVNDVPRGSTVRARCRPGKAKRCPLGSSFKKFNARGSVSLKSFLRKRYRSGTTIEVRVTKKGMIGAVKRLSMHRRTGPSVKTLCLPPGAKASAKPVKCSA